MNSERSDHGDGNETERRRFASPVCSMADVDPAYSGRLPADELLDLLNELLEGERAGARGITETCLPMAPPLQCDALREIAGDEGRFCTVLYRHIARLGGIPGTATGAFVDKLAQRETFIERLQLLNRGQIWVVRKLVAALPRIDDEALHTDLTEMLRVHERNIERCDTLLRA